MKKIAIIAATGFEDTELTSAVNIFNRSKLDWEIISIENLNEVSGQASISNVKTKKWDDINWDIFDGIFLPGGIGHKILLNSKELKEILISFNTDNKTISAICAAPEVLLEAGIIKDKKITSFPGFAKNGNNTGGEVEVDGNIITGRDFEATIKFAKVVVKEINK